MLRYSVLRLLMFFGVLSLLWLLHVRDQWMLLVLSALISMVLSYFVLARFREESTRQLAERVQRRAEAKQAAAAAGPGTVRGRDEDAEDTEDTEAAEDEDGPARYR